MISHRLKFAQILLGPSDSAKEEYILCACNFFDKISKKKEKIELVNLDPFCEINSILFNTDIRHSIDTNFNIGSSNELLSFNIEILEKSLQNPDWFCCAFEGSQSPYFIINISTRIEMTAFTSIYDSLIKQLLDLNFRIVLINIFPASLITRPSLLISAKMSMLSYLFSLNIPKLPFVSVFTEVNTLNEDDSESFQKLINDDLENRDELLGGIDAPEEIGGITSSICELLATTENFAVIDSLDTEDDSLVESFFSHIDDLLGYNFIERQKSSSDDDIKKDNSKSSNTTHEKDDDEEEDVLFTTIITQGST